MRCYWVLWSFLALFGLGPVQAEPAPTISVWFKELSKNGSTRGTAYSMSNKILSLQDQIVVGWLDHISDVQIATFDRGRRAWSAPVFIGRGTDNHCGPTLAVDGAGYLHAIFGTHQTRSHDGPLQYRRSKHPLDASVWEPIETLGERSCYPSLVVGLRETLHCTSRGGSDPRPRRLVYHRKKRGARWEAPRELYSTGLRPMAGADYTQYGNALAVDAVGTLHLGFHVYDVRPPGGKAVGYLRSRDRGDTWESADGVAVRLPAGPESPVFIEKDPNFDMRIGNLALDRSGRPWLAVLHLEASPRRLVLWCLEQGHWQAVEMLAVLEAKQPGKEFLSATITFDRNDRLYVAATVMEAGAEKWVANPDKPGKFFGHPLSEVVLFLSDNGGKTFDLVPVSEPDRQKPNWLPSIERPSSSHPIGTPHLLFTHGGPGKGLKDGPMTNIWFATLDGGL